MLMLLMIIMERGLRSLSSCNFLQHLNIFSLLGQTQVCTYIIINNGYRPTCNTFPCGNVYPPNTASYKRKPEMCTQFYSRNFLGVQEEEWRAPVGWIFGRYKVRKGVGGIGLKLRAVVGYSRH
jgi:hypothetical protein